MNRWGRAEDQTSTVLPLVSPCLTMWFTAPIYSPNYVYSLTEAIFLP